MIEASETGTKDRERRAEMSKDSSVAGREKLVAYLRDQVACTWTAVSKIEKAFGQPVGDLLAAIPGVQYDGGHVRYAPETQVDLETAIVDLVQRYEEHLREQRPGDVLAEYREVVDAACTILIDRRGMRYQWIDGEAVKAPREMAVLLPPAD